MKKGRREKHYDEEAEDGKKSRLEIGGRGKCKRGKEGNRQKTEREEIEERKVEGDIGKFRQITY